MSQQHQFLDVIDRDEAERRFQAALDLQPVGEEVVSLSAGLGRVLARDVTATTNVPSFDRSNYDGFAVVAADTYGAHEETPRSLTLAAQRLDPGIVPDSAVTPGTAIAIATGGMVPRGADAVVMVEHCDVDQSATPRRLLVRRAVHSGFGISFAATDVSAGETVLRAGDILSSRATGVLAAIGVTQIHVYRRPNAAIISTGDEIIAPGDPMEPGLVYDSNARILADAVREAGGEPRELGIVRDDIAALRRHLDNALETSDTVILSGGTSKGQGDLSYRVVQQLDDPGIVAHGVALKPGKPICLAASQGKPVVILPGFPTSAIFTFHEFVAPVIRRLAGRPRQHAAKLDAQLAVKVNSEIGRTEYLLVGLVHAAGDPSQRSEDAQLAATGRAELIAYPMGKGSGSVTTFSHADGFITIGRNQEIVEAGAPVQVQLLGQHVATADLVVIGSHCVGLDYLLGELQRRGWRTKFMAVGSLAGLEAARRGECDAAGIHLIDPATGEYNRPLLTPEIDLIAGYGRRQGIVYRRGDARFENRAPQQALAAAIADPSCVMVNRNRGSGTRILIDRLLQESTHDAQPAGYAVQVKNHHAVAAAVEQGRADWGVAIETVVAGHQADLSQTSSGRALGFIPLEDEQFDLVVPQARRDRPAVKALVDLMREPEVRQHLQRLGFRPAESGDRDSTSR